jgi:hypothetical protein
MSSVTTTKIDTINGTTNLTLTTGNTVGPKIVVTTTTDQGIGFGNSSSNSLVVNSSGVNVTTNNFTLGSFSLGANGYTRLPNGLLLQWGSATATVNNSTTAEATFSTSFSTLYSVTVTTAGYNVSTPLGQPSTINATSTSSFTWKTNYAAPAASATINYIAIGT